MTDAKGPPVLVVGTGFGCRVHVPALRAAGFEVVGLVGTNTERTERRAAANGVPDAFSDLDEAISKTGARAVTIATPPNTHARLTLTALSRGCHVICEKPFAMNADEARVMLGAAEKAAVTHLVGNEFRWLPERALVALALAEGLIGEPRFMTLAQYIPLVADPETKMPRWWFDADAGGGWLGASGSHLIDLVRTWLGEFDTLSAILPTVSERRRGAEDSFVFRFRMKNGAEGILQNTAAAWGPSANLSRVAGTKGTLWIEGSKVQIADRNGVRDLKVGPDLELPLTPQPSGDPHKPSSSFEIGPYIRLCEAFRAGIDGRDFTDAVLPATFADGVACMEVMDAIRQSDRNNGSLVPVR